MGRGFRFLKWATRSERRTSKPRQGMFGLSPHHRRLVCEPLEDRRLLSVLTVTDVSDSISDTGSLRYNLSIANAGDTIAFSSGLAGPIKVTNGILEISKPLTIQGPGAGQLTIDGTKNGIHNVFQIDAGIHNVQIDNLTITAASYDPISNSSGYLSVAGCTLSGSDGIYFDSTKGGSLTVSNSNLSNNTSTGIYRWGSGGTATVPVTITGCSISKNSGSGLYIYESATNLVTSVQGCVISGNSNYGIFTVGTLAVTGSTISGSGGCGINNGDDQGKVTLIDSTVWGNSGAASRIGAR